MADKVNHTVHQGTDFRRALEFRDEAGALMDLTGYVFRGQVRTAYEAPVVFSFVFTLRDQIAETGMVDLHIPSASTASLSITEKTEYLYDVEMVDAEEEVRRVMEGKLFLLPEVTK